MHSKIEELIEFSKIIPEIKNKVREYEEELCGKVIMYKGSPASIDFFSLNLTSVNLYIHNENGGDYNITIPLEELLEWVY